MLILSISFFSLLFHSFFVHVLHITSPQNLLSLTTWGIHRGFLWQFFSYPFVQPLTSGTISLSIVLHMFFNVYLVWSVGSTIIHTRSVRHFMGLYFGGTLFLGILAYITLTLSHSPASLAGSNTMVYILLVAWTFLFPRANVVLFFPIQAKWLVFGGMLINLFLYFSNGDFVPFIITTGSLLYGYFYAVLAWNILSPFPQLHRFERKIIFLKRKLTHRFHSFMDIEIYPSKMYDLKTGKAIIKDEKFVDACLEKIALQGKHSLTLRERWRLRRISRKRS